MSVVSSNIRSSGGSPQSILTLPRKKSWLSRSLMWICLILAMIGASWFSFQAFLVPQPKDFTPNWHDAHWIQASGSTAPVAYFRYSPSFNVLPDGAFVTVVANQVFRLYVNGYFIGSNTHDFVLGSTNQTYMFDISSALVPGANAIGFRVANVDNTTPQLRANLAVIWGQEVHYYGSDRNWQATAQASQAHLRNVASNIVWSTPKFDVTQWPAAQQSTQVPRATPLRVNPLVYEQPMPSHWLSAGAGREGYFVHQVSLPVGIDNAFLRVIATGEADIFINDHLYMKWNGQPDIPQANVTSYLDDTDEPVIYHNGLQLGVYDITPMLHAGTNTIAVHVLYPGTSLAKVGLDSLKNALSMDLFVGASGAYQTPLAKDAGWHASVQPTDGWTAASSGTISWKAPYAIGRPGVSRTFFLPASNTTRNEQVTPPVLIGEVIVWSIAALLAVWLCVALLVMRRHYRSKRDALEATSLVFLPALAVEAFLIALSREPLLPQPFPYTWQWGLVLIALVGLTTAFLKYHVRKMAQQGAKGTELDVEDKAYADYRPNRSALQTGGQSTILQLTHKQKALYWLRHNWAILPVMLIAVPLVCFNPGYEPYWQDELASYFVARNIMAHGLHAFPSGFIYPKAELFSYVLAAVMAIFGTTSSVVPRTISITEYMISLPLLYVVGTKLFNKRIGWLATVMLALSPYAMIWSRQTRMYEQAQLMVIIVLGVFYWAIQNRNKTYPIYIAIACLLVAYLSHEEVFIILPAVVTCVLLGSREGRYGIPSVVYKKHWWIATLIGVCIIGLELSSYNIFLALHTPTIHQPEFATDQSLRPQIQLTTDNIPYYFNLLFVPKELKDGPTPWVMASPFLLVNTLLAILGSILAFCRQDKRARYCAIFLLLSSITLIFVFTMQADRYYYPLLPMYYLMGAYAFYSVLQAIWGFARPHLQLDNQVHRVHGVQARLLQPILVGIVALLCVSVLLVPMLPLSNFNLLMSRVTGIPYHRHYADYDDAANYIHSHMQKGDAVMTIAPAVSILYYVGHVDDYFSIDRALFVIESNSRLMETSSGTHPLLNQADFQTALAMHKRVWIISDNGGYQGGVTKDGRFSFPPPDFRLVYEGYGSSVYVRGDGS